jgi:hypothetical protein
MHTYIQIPSKARHVDDLGGGGGDLLMATWSPRVLMLETRDRQREEHRKEKEKHLGIFSLQHLHVPEIALPSLFLSIEQQQR